MKIAQIAPLAESCPPRLYGGSERIVSYLTEELVRQGHEVTLFASGDSVTAAELVPCSDIALRFDASVSDQVPHYVVMLEKIRRRAEDFDVLHFHIEYLHFGFARSLPTPTVTTLHGRLDSPDAMPFYLEFRDFPLASISHAQRKPMPPVNWVGNVYHGLPPDLLPFTARPEGGYLAFLGRVSPEKRPDQAIRIAARAGLPLKIAAKIDRADQSYWDSVIRPMIDAHDGVEYIGEVDERQKAAFLGNALALLFPIDWPEPFGLVMIEAMACGTPVIAHRSGSVPEVVDDGVSGFIVDSMEQAVDAVHKIELLDRAGVRAAFEDRFTVNRMAQDYVSIYRALTGIPTGESPAVVTPMERLHPMGQSGRR